MRPMMLANSCGQWRLLGGMVAATCWPLVCPHPVRQALTCETSNWPMERKRRAVVVNITYQERYMSVSSCHKRLDIIVRECRECSQ